MNTAVERCRVAPKSGEWRHGLTDDGGRYKFPAYSVTVLRLE
jgi:hypothetical protein